MGGEYQLLRVGLPAGKLKAEFLKAGTGRGTHLEMKCNVRSELWNFWVLVDLLNFCLTQRSVIGKLRTCRFKGKALNGTRGMRLSRCIDRVP